MRHKCLEIINMLLSLCEALLVCILTVTVTVQSFEVMFVKCNVGGVSTSGKDIS